MPRGSVYMGFVPGASQSGSDAAWNDPTLPGPHRRALAGPFTVVSSTGATATLGTVNGAISAGDSIIVRGGTGAGQTRVVQSYVTGTKVLTPTVAFSPALDNTSLIDIFAGSAAEVTIPAAGSSNVLQARDIGWLATPQGNIVEAWALLAGRDITGFVAAGASAVVLDQLELVVEGDAGANVASSNPLGPINSEPYRMQVYAQLVSGAALTPAEMVAATTGLNLRFESPSERLMDLDTIQILAYSTAPAACIVRIVENGLTSITKAGPCLVTITAEDSLIGNAQAEETQYFWEIHQTAGTPMTESVIDRRPGMADASVPLVPNVAWSEVEARRAPALHRGICLTSLYRPGTYSITCHQVRWDYTASARVVLSSDPITLTITSGSWNEVTVGTGGDYATLAACAAGESGTVGARASMVKVRLLSGHTEANPSTATFQYIDGLWIVHEDGMAFDAFTRTTTGQICSIQHCSDVVVEEVALSSASGITSTQRPNFLNGCLDNQRLALWRCRAEYVQSLLEISDSGNNDEVFVGGCSIQQFKRYCLFAGGANNRYGRYIGNDSLTNTSQTGEGHVRLAAQGEAAGKGYGWQVCYNRLDSNSTSHSSIRGGAALTTIYANYRKGGGTFATVERGDSSAQYLQFNKRFEGEYSETTQGFDVGGRGPHIMAINCRVVTSNGGWTAPELRFSNRIACCVLIPASTSSFMFGGNTAAMSVSGRHEDNQFHGNIFAMITSFTGSHLRNPRNWQAFHSCRDNAFALSASGKWEDGNGASNTDYTLATLNARANHSGNVHLAILESDLTAGLRPITDDGTTRIVNPVPGVWTDYAGYMRSFAPGALWLLGPGGDDPAPALPGGTGRGRLRSRIRRAAVTLGLIGGAQ